VHTVALVGGNGGKLAALGNDVLVVNDTHYGRVEDCHMHIAHMICYAFIELEALQQPAS
jgi:D-sedoheptulose 7-phosphate isomerase